MHKLRAKTCKELQDTYIQNAVRELLLLCEDIQYVSGL